MKYYIKDLEGHEALDKSYVSKDMLKVFIPSKDISWEKEVYKIPRKCYFRGFVIQGKKLFLRLERVSNG